VIWLRRDRFGMLFSSSVLYRAAVSEYLFGSFRRSVLRSLVALAAASTFLSFLLRHAAYILHQSFELPHHFFKGEWALHGDSNGG
jgi:hypothetical protein